MSNNQKLYVKILKFLKESLFTIIHRNSFDNLHDDDDSPVGVKLLSPSSDVVVPHKV